MVIIFLNHPFHVIIIQIVLVHLERRRYSYGTWAAVGELDPTTAMLTSVDNLPVGMWFYSFMFGEKKPFVPQYIAEGRLPVPSSLLVGVGAGVALTVGRLALDWAVFKVHTTVSYDSGDSSSPCIISCVVALLCCLSSARGRQGLG